MARTAAAPAVKASDLLGGCVAIALTEFAVVPMTCFRDRPASARPLLLGAFIVAALANGELEGVCLGSQAEALIRD